MNDEITLTEMARELGIHKSTLLSRLEPLHRELLGAGLLRKTKRRIWVNRAVLAQYRSSVLAAVVSSVSLGDRVTQVEHEVLQLREDVSGLQARVG